MTATIAKNESVVFFIIYNNLPLPFYKLIKIAIIDRLSIPKIQTKKMGNVIPVYCLLFNYEIMLSWQELDLENDLLIIS